MQQKLNKHIKNIDNILKENKIKNKDELIKNHLKQIEFYQHERLIHLIVTVFVGIVMALFFIGGLILENILVLILFILTLVLFVPYILHYYVLENGVQKMYDQYWNLLEK
jgi:hypothetical protein